MKEGSRGETPTIVQGLGPTFPESSSPTDQLLQRELEMAEREEMQADLPDILRAKVLLLSINLGENIHCVLVKGTKLHTEENKRFQNH